MIHILENIITQILPVIISICELIGIFVVTVSALTAFWGYLKGLVTHKSTNFKFELAQGLASGLEFKMAAEKIKRAQDTVDLYESRGMRMTPELINQIYEEMTGMSFALAMNYYERNGQESEPEIVTKMDDCERDGQESESEIVMKMDDCDTDVQEFSIVMNSIDMDIINYVANLFKNKKISVSLSVKQWYTQDEME